MEALERGLGRLASIWKGSAEFGHADLLQVAGAGAAGGLAAGLMAYCGGRLRGGFELIASHVGLDDAVRRADLVITAEGMVDCTAGKVRPPVSRDVLPHAVDDADDVPGPLGSCPGLRWPQRSLRDADGVAAPRPRPRSPGTCGNGGCLFHCTWADIAPRVQGTRRGPAVNNGRAGGAMLPKRNESPFCIAIALVTDRGSGGD